MNFSAPAFGSPEEAAIDGFPPAHVRVVACSVEGDEAYVVLDTGPAGYPELYGSTVSRGAEGWLVGTSGNGPSAGWTLTAAKGDLGTAFVYGDAPAGADRVRASLDGDTQDAEVRDGYYLVAWWRVPSSAPEPRLLGFRVGGEWSGTWPAP